MSELPDGWAEVRTDEAGVLDLGRQRSPKYHSGPNMKPYLRVANVFEDRIDSSDVKTMHFEPEAFERSKLHTGDVLLNEGQSPEWLGRPAIYRGEPPDVAFTNSLIRFRPTPAVAPEWALIVFRHHMHSGRFARESRITTNIAHLSASRLAAVEFRVPPVAEQHRIVTMTEEAFSKLDAGGAGLRAVRDRLKRMREAVLAAGCRGELTRYWRQAASPTPISQTLSETKMAIAAKGRDATTDLIPGRCILAVGKPSDSEVPVGWQWVQVTDVARLESGHTPSRRHPEYWDQGVPWMSIQDARDHHGARISETRQHISPSGLANSSARLLPAGTVCLSRTASVGYVVVMDHPMATSQDFVNWVCTEALVPQFLQLALMAEGDEIRRFGRGTTHTTIYYPELKALHICLPSVEEQERIVAEVDRQLSYIRVCERAVEVGITRSEVLRRAVLKAAFDGRLVPQDPSDQPASVLLELDRTERLVGAEATGRRGRKEAEQT